MRAGLIAAAVSLVAAGCGSGEVPPADTGSATTPAATTPGTTVGGTGTTGASLAEEPGMNEISASQAGSGVTVKVSSRTPKAFVAANCARPIIVVLHQPTSILDQELLKEVRIAVKKTKDELLLIYTPSMVREYGDLPSKLGLFAAPGVAIVARDGTIENIWSGVYLDNKLIEASLRNAAAATACKVAEGQAAGGATATNSLQGAAALVAGGAAPAATTPGAAAGTVPGAAAGTVPGTTGAATTVPGAATNTGTTIDPTTGMPAAATTASATTTGTVPATTPGAVGATTPTATGGGR